MNAALAEFLAGNIDIFNPSTVDQISQIRQAVQQGRLDATIKVNASPVASSQFMVFNWNKASDPFKQSLFRSDKFRRAMSHLVNRQAVIDIVYGGLGIPMYSSVYPVLTQWINPKVPKYEYDPKQAAKLLAELGFTKKDREGYLVDSKGRRIEFNLATNAGNTQREQIAKLIVDEAKKVGVKVNFQAIDFNTLVGQLLSSGPDRPFDAIIIGLTGGGLDWPFGSNVVPCKGNLHMWNKSGQCLDPGRPSWRSSTTRAARSWTSRSGWRSATACRRLRRSSSPSSTSPGPTTTPPGTTAWAASTPTPSSPASGAPVRWSSPSSRSELA